MRSLLFFLPFQRKNGEFIVFSRDHVPPEYWKRNDVYTYVNSLCWIWRDVTAALYLLNLRYIFNQIVSRQATQTRKH